MSAILLPLARFGVLVLALTARPAAARDPIQPGNAVNARGALGVVVGRDAASLFHNPASLVAQARPEASVDLAVARITHGYEHPKFAPFAFNAVVPLTTLGAAVAIGKRLHLGLAAFPTGVGTRSVIAGLPVDVTPVDAARSTVTAKQTALDLALGGNVRIGSSLAVGLSLVPQLRKNELEIEIDGVDRALLDATFSGTFVKLVVGARATLGCVTLGLSLSPAMAKRYHGTSTMPALNSTEPYDLEYTEYAPATIGVGAALARGRWQASAEASLEDHRSGRTTARSGFGASDPRATALKNVLNAAVAASVRLRDDGSLFAGLGRHPGNLGDATFAGQGGPGNLGVAGMRFGALEGLDRYAGGAGYAQSAGAWNLTAGGFFVSGRSRVGEGRPGQGEYSLTILGLTLSARLSL